MSRRKAGHLSWGKKGAGEILHALQQKDMTAYALQEKAGTTYNTVIERLEQFQKAGYLEENKGTYSLTSCGTVVARALFGETEPGRKKR
jgi:predicted transcriptional regulator